MLILVLVTEGLVLPLSLLVQFLKSLYLFDLDAEDLSLAAVQPLTNSICCLRCSAESFADQQCRPQYSVFFQSGLIMRAEHARMTGELLENL